MFLPAIRVIDGINFLSDMQFTSTAMSPAEYSRKHRQRTGTLNKWAGGGNTGALGAAEPYFFD
jgi:hypothetical protein